ncbi:MAG: hypothetical protein Q9183_000600 [Haloplaca sp. 2 TL-2023]
MDQLPPHFALGYNDTGIQQATAGSRQAAPGIGPQTTSLISARASGNQRLPNGHPKRVNEVPGALHKPAMPGLESDPFLDDLLGIGQNDQRDNADADFTKSGDLFEWPGKWGSSPFGFPSNAALPQTLNRLRDKSPQLLSAWKFGQPNPHAILRPVSPVNEQIQTCPFFIPGCDCMLSGLASNPIYLPNVERADAENYTKTMSYIPVFQVARRERVPSTRAGLKLPPLPVFPGSGRGSGHGSTTGIVDGSTLESSMASAPKPASGALLAPRHTQPQQVTTTTPTRKRTNPPFEASLGQPPKSPSEGSSMPSAYQTPSRPRPKVGDFQNPYLTPTSSRKPAGPSVTGLEGTNTPTPTGTKRTSEDRDEVLSIHDGSQPEAKRSKRRPTRYTEDEQAMTERYVRYVVSRGNQTESKWAEVRQLLLSEGVDKSPSSIKNYWSRFGRENSKFDERQKVGKNLITSKQDPENRKRNREQKKHQDQQIKREDSQ